MLRIGDAIWIGGGEGIEPEWQRAESGYEGILRRFLAGPAAGWAVVELDDAISVAGVTGRWLLLSLCHHDAAWGESGTVNVILSAAEPRAMVTRKGPGIEWVESRARYKRL